MTRQVLAARLVNRPRQQRTLAARRPVAVSGRAREPGPQPVKITVRLQDSMRRQSVGLAAGPFFRNGSPRRRSAQDQSVARPRKRDVKEPQFFSQQLAPLPPLRQPVREAGIHLTGVGRLHFRAQTEVLVQNHALLQVVKIEPFPKVRNQHHWKLEPFALMNAHQLDGVFRGH